MPDKTRYTVANSSEPLDARLYELFSAAIGDGLGIVKRIEEQGAYIGGHWEWPKLTYRKNGLPSLSEEYTAPKDYGAALRTAGRSDKKVASSPFSAGKPFHELLTYARSHARISSHLGTPDADLIDDFLEILVGDILDRYVHLHPGFILQLEYLFLPVEKYLLEESLNIALIVPILFLNFDDDQFELDDHTSIVKMNDDLNLARAPQTRFSYGRHPIVEESAAFALLRLGYSLPNTSRVANWQILGAAESYPTDIVDQFFASLNIVTGYSSGYAQLLALPLGWASDYKGTLMPLHKTSVRNYPQEFEHTDWDAPIQVVDRDQAGALARCFAALGQHGSNRRLSIAVRRLNRRALRTSPEDGVLDLTIALEALLTDGNQEMTHKIALRTAALYKLIEPSRSPAVFKEIKDVYNYRSTIVHGASVDSNKTVSTRNVSIESAAVEHVRAVLGVVLERPEFLDPRAIDQKLLLTSAGLSAASD